MEGRRTVGWGWGGRGEIRDIDFTTASDWCRLIAVAVIDVALEEALGSSEGLGRFLRRRVPIRRRRQRSASSMWRRKGKKNRHGVAIGFRAEDGGKFAGQ